MKLFENLIIFACLHMLVGCGYFGDDPVEDSRVYRSEKLANTCEIDVEGLSHILKEDVEKQIDCLEENLISFSRYVKRADQDHVTDSELKGFVRRFFKGHAELITGSMTLIFDINSLFLKDSRTSISSENIKPLFNLLKITNKEVSGLVKTLYRVDEGELPFYEGKRSLEKRLSSFSQQVKAIITQAGKGAETSINLKEFYDHASEQFSNLKIETGIFNSILSFKKLILGGKRNILTRGELFVILDNLPKLGSAAYTLIHTINKQKSNPNQYRTYLNQLDILTENLYHHRREEEIFKRGEVEELIEIFFSEKSSSYENLFKKFKANMLLNKNDRIGLTYKDVRNSLSLGKIFLRGMMFYNEFQVLIPQKGKIDRGSWRQVKKLVTDLFKDLREGVKDEVNGNIFFPERMEYIDFIQFINDEFENIGLPEVILDGLPIAKVALVGGQKQGLTKLEVLNIVDKSLDFADIFFDFFYATDANHSEQEMSGLYYKNLKKGKFLLTGQQYLHVATLDELIVLVSKVATEKYDDKYNVMEYIAPLAVLKEKIIGGYPKSMTVGDLAKFLDLAQGYFSRNYFFDISFDVHKKDLLQNKEVLNLRYKHHSKFTEFDADEIILLRKEFESLVGTYRLFRNDEGNVYIGEEFKRTKKGILEIHLIQYFYNLIAEGFGQRDPDTGLRALNIDQINSLQHLLEPILKDIGMRSAKPESFARNVLLLADLFQGQSNGNLSLDVREATEYGVLALFAIQTADRFVQEIKENKCDWFEYEEEGGRIVEGFKLDCYRPFFFDILFNKFELRKELPKLAAYIDEAGAEEALKYLISIEGFARESRDQNRPQTQKDMILLIGALANIESTFLRYDTDHSNYIEPQELDRAFPVYEEAIMMLANLNEGKRAYAETIFKYMIKNMSLPSSLQVGLYHYNPFQTKNIGSKRINIGALLYNLIIAAEESSTQKSSE